MNPRCPKCSGKLAPRTDQVGVSGNVLGQEQVVHCLNCGWSISRPDPNRDALYRNIPIKSVKGYAKPNYTAPKTPRPKLYASDCRVAGCSGKAVFYSKSGLCSRCNKSMTSWNSSKQTKLPPFMPHPHQDQVLLRIAERSR